MSPQLASMTGYARNTGAVDDYNFQIEVKTVNARGLDIRLRLSPGLDILEPKIRRLIAQSLKRGSVNCTISIQRGNSSSRVQINQAALATVLEALEFLSKKVDAAPPSLDGILGLSGVLENRDQSLDESVEKYLNSEIMISLEQVLKELLHERVEEGKQLASFVCARIDEIEMLTDQAENHPSRNRKTVLDRLNKQIAELTEKTPALSEDRLHLEALLLATKADIREELDRLYSHIKAARNLLKQGEAVGRKLDFLAQEFNREANTLCSKSRDVELTTIGLDLKASIDQLREQVQNIE